MTSTVILSPHQDDAVLSLWHILAGEGEVSVVNVFVGVPATERLGWWDAETGASDPASRAQERREEDRTALALAGRSATDLNFLDAQYRERKQPSEPIAAAIAAVAPDDALLLAPAALGPHLDHRLTREAALALRERGRRVALYADIPHATREGWPPWVTDGASTHGANEPSESWRAAMNGSGIELGELDPEVHVLDPDEARSKLAAVGRYRTQLAALEAEYSMQDRQEVLRFEVIWPLSPGDGGRSR